MDVATFAYVLVLLLVLLGGTALVVTLARKGTVMDSLYEDDDPMDDGEPWSDDPEPDSGDEADLEPFEDEPEQEWPNGPAPLVAHPDKPPYMVYYTPRPGREHVERLCFCHRKQVLPGDHIMLWTRPDSSVLIICADSVQAALDGRPG